MTYQTPTSRVTFLRSLWLPVLVLVGVFVFLLPTLRSPQQASAATSSYLNFQARLEGTSGAIAPDGNYNIEFNLYGNNGGSACVPSTGVNCTVLWTEDRLNSTATAVHTTNGYVTANLGSVTAFPTTINWDQQLYISMTVRGTGSCAFAACTPADSAMLPYLQLTSVPYAFKAGQLAQANAGATLFSSLSIQAPTVGNQNFVVQDQGAAGTYNLLTQSGSTGIAGLGTASSLTGALKFYSSAGAGSVTLSLANPGANNYTLTIPTLTGNDTICTVTGGCGASSGANVTLSNLTGPTAINTDLTFASGAARALTVGATGAGVAGNNLTVAGGTSGTGAVNGGNLILQGGATGGTGTTGSVIVKANGTDSTTAFQVQNATGAATIMSVDTINSKIVLTASTTDAVLGTAVVDTGGSTPFTTSWTTTGWTVTATQATHTTNNTSVLTSNWTPTIGTTYQVQYYYGGCVPGVTTLVVSMGGKSLQTINDCPGNNTQVITATSTAPLTFTPNSAFNSIVYSVVVKPLTTQAAPVITVNNSSSTATLEIRSSGSTSNIFIGLNAGQNNTSTGTNNSAVGTNALQGNTTGLGNSAYGSSALQVNSTGGSNAAFGYLALGANTTGNNSTAIGASALTNAYGSNNTAVGYSAGSSLTNASNNTFIGYQAGYKDSGNSFTTTSTVANSTAIGAYAQVQGNNSIVLGSVDTATKIGIGTTLPTNTLSVSPLDYSGNSSRTNSSATLTGFATTFTAGMVGDIIVFSDGTTNTVSGYTDATHITMGTVFTGTTGSMNFRFHRAGFQVTSAGNAYVQNNSTTAFQVQNASGVSVLGVDTSGGQAILGQSGTAGKMLIYGSTNSVTLTAAAVTTAYTITLPAAAPASNGQCLQATTAGVTSWGTCGGGGGGTQTITLVPEFSGAVFTADGSNNVGFMTSDHVSGLVSGQGYKHNFYAWSTDQVSAQDYNVTSEYQLPSGFSNFTGSVWKMWVYGDNAGDVISYTIKDAAENSCATGSFTTATTATWSQQTLSTSSLTTAPCSYAANDTITIDFKLSSASSSSTSYVKLGEVSFTYN
jgi:hypothetical protein